MSSSSKKERISFKATKIVSKPVKVEFRNSQTGKMVSFRAHRDVPKVVQVNFLKKEK